MYQKKKKKKKTRNKTKKKRKKNVFVFCLNLLQDAYIPFLIFLFEEKRKEIWLSSMANSHKRSKTSKMWAENTSQNWQVSWCNIKLQKWFG